MHTRPADDPGEVFLELTGRERYVLMATLLELVYALPAEVMKRAGLADWALADVEDCLGWRQPPICDAALLRDLATALRTLVVELDWEYPVRADVDAQDARQLGEALDAAAEELDAAPVEIDATVSGVGAGAGQVAATPDGLQVVAVTESCVELRCAGGPRAALIGALVEATATDERHLAQLAGLDVHEGSRLLGALWTNTPALVGTATTAALARMLRQVARSLGSACESRVGVPAAGLLAVADALDERLSGSGE